jgi:hypothetical protein
MTDRAASWLRERLLGDRDAAGLAAFRVAIGLLALVSALRFLHYGWVDELFVRPRFFFTYSFAPFVQPLGATGMRVVFWTIAAAGALVAAGLFYRAAIATLFVAFTYVQLIDVTNYLNHYYLVSLLTLLMSFMPLGACWGLDGLLRARLTGQPARTTLPGWCYALLRTQVAVVYTYAGVAKLTSDWIVYAQPLDIWLSSRTSLPVLGPILAHPWAPHAMAWAGCLFDLTIAGWLSWCRSRPLAFAAVLGFHAVTRYLFPIGMFPFIMISAATIFFEPSWPRRFLPLAPPQPAPLVVWPTPRFAALVLVTGLYVALQVLAPLRTFIHAGNVHWHEQGMRFSWRVMVREKNASVLYYVDDLTTGRTVEVKPRRYLDARQEREFGTQPDLVLQLGRHIGREWEARAGGPVRVRAEVLVSLNGRRSQLLVDPELDLLEIDDAYAGRWILPEPKGSPPFLHGGERRATAGY